MRKITRREALGAGLIGLAGVVVGGCNDALISELSREVATAGAIEAVRTEIAGPRGTTVVVNNENVNTENQQPNENLEIILCNDAIDINKDGAISKDEIFGYGRTAYNLDREKFSCIVLGEAGNMCLQSWTIDGKLIGETQKYLESGKLIRYFTQPGGAEIGDFMDNLRKYGPGDYSITATKTESRKTVRVNFTITRAGDFQEKIQSRANQIKIKEDLDLSLVKN